MKWIHDITVWKQEGLDQFGNPQYGSPRHTKGRWEERSRMYVSDDGRDTRFGMPVYLKNDVAERGDRIKKGIFTGEPPEDAREVKDYRNIPNLRGTKREIRVMV